jgi:tetratricopeptide (TPR) repeat protein
VTQDAPTYDQSVRRSADALRSGDTEEALAFARFALRAKPGDPIAQHLMGLAFFDSGEYDLSYEIFDALSHRRPEEVPIRVNAALAAMLNGRDVEANSHLQHVLALVEHSPAFVLLAWIHLRGDDLPMAVAALQQAGLEDLAERAGASEAMENLVADVRQTLRELAREQEMGDPAATFVEAWLTRSWTGEEEADEPEEADAEKADAEKAYADTEAEPDETEPDETEPDETEPDETEPDETEPDETEPDETEPDETEPDETEPDETEPEKAAEKASKEAERVAEDAEKAAEAAEKAAEEAKEVEASEETEAEGVNGARAEDEPDDVDVDLDGEEAAREFMLEADPHDGDDETRPHFTRSGTFVAPKEVVELEAGSPASEDANDVAADDADSSEDVELADDIGGEPTKTPASEPVAKDDFALAAGADEPSASVSLVERKANALLRRLSTPPRAPRDPAVWARPTEEVERDGQLPRRLTVSGEITVSSSKRPRRKWQRLPSVVTSDVDVDALEDESLVDWSSGDEDTPLLPSRPSEPQPQPQPDELAELAQALAEVASGELEAEIADQVEEMVDELSTVEQTVAEQTAPSTEQSAADSGDIELEIPSAPPEPATWESRRNRGVTGPMLPIGLPLASIEPERVAAPTVLGEISETSGELFPFAEKVAPLTAQDFARHTLALPLVGELAAGDRIEIRKGRLFLRFGAWKNKNGDWSAVLRSDLLSGWQGRLRAMPVHCRRRGAKAERFERPEGEFVALEGDAVAIVDPPDEKRFDLLWLGANQVAYVRESALVAFAGTLQWDNGHLPGAMSPAMARFSGDGVVVVASEGLECWMVKETAPVVIRQDSLVGWMGDVIVCPACRRSVLGYTCEGKGTLIVSNRMR